jgi:hypothetical protein
MNTRTPLLILMMASGLILAACEAVVVSSGHRHRGAVVVAHPAPPLPPPVVVVEQHPGPPPPWAPAHGYRNKHEFRYYYQEQVYYCIGSGEWFWLESGNWHFGMRLPSRILISSDNIVIDLDGPRPMPYHTQVVQVYPRTYRRVAVDRGGPPPGRGRSGPPGPPAGRGGGGRGNGRGRGR